MVSKINSAELNIVTRSLYKGEDVYDFIETLDVDRSTALKILDFIQNYANDFEVSKKNDELYYRGQINNLEGEIDDAADQLRIIVKSLERGE
jgi:hypothetical protein